jgi:hypothetical protein
VDAGNPYCTSMCMGHCGSYQGCNCGGCSGGYYCNTSYTCQPTGGVDAGNPMCSSYCMGHCGAYMGCSCGGCSGGGTCDPYYYTCSAADAGSTACDVIQQDCLYPEACYPSASGNQCAAEGSIDEGNACTNFNDCYPGMACLGYCYYLCDPANSDCTPPEVCHAVTQTNYGICY